VRRKLRETLPQASISTLRKLNELYPPPGLSLGLFANQFERIDDLISGTYMSSRLNKEWIFNCNVRYITQAYGNDTYNYIYSLVPSIHSSDVIFTFTDLVFDHGGQRHNFNLNYVKAWQSYLISFIKHGDPNIERDKQSTIPWGLAGNEMRAINMKMRGIEWVEDEQMDEERCAFWQRAEYAAPWNTSGTHSENTL
jgi:carboxylesterase type B